MPNAPLTIGWREWVCLPALGVRAIKVKVDTGARTSAIHAFDLEPYRERGRDRVRFALHPLQRQLTPTVRCDAVVLDQRSISDSGGHREKRWVVETLLRLGHEEWPIELTLTNRDSMQFRMLLGRTAMAGHVVIRPGASFVQGRELAGAYRQVARRKRDTRR